MTRAVSPAHSNEPMNVIYGLHLGDRRYRYVGLTSKGAKSRLSSHRANANRGVAFPVYLWMRKHGVDKVHVDVLDQTDDPTLLDSLERTWIAKLKAEGFDLLNCNDGGGSARGFTIARDATYRARMSERLMGRNLSEAHKASISKALTGRVIGESARRNMGAAKKGHRYNLGSKRSIETKMLMSQRDRSGHNNGFYGKTHSQDVRDKLSRDRKGLPNPATHTRWHKNRGISKPETCKFCKEEKDTNDT